MNKRGNSHLHLVQRMHVRTVHPIRGSRRSCFASKTLELCRDVKKEKKEPVDSKLKIQKFGGKIRQKRIQNITNRDSTNFRHQAALPCLPSRVLFLLFTSRHNSSAFDAKHDRRDAFIEGFSVIYRRVLV